MIQRLFRLNLLHITNVVFTQNGCYLKLFRKHIFQELNSDLVLRSGELIDVSIIFDVKNLQIVAFQIGLPKSFNILSALNMAKQLLISS